MGIQKRIKTAEQHLASGDFENAFIQALIAVDATAKKRYPNEKNRARYINFLREDFWKNIAPNISIQGGYVKVHFRGETRPLVDILYELRCELLHEGVISENLRFLPIDGLHIIPGDDFLELSYAIPEMLISSVKNAPENAGLF